MSVPRRLPFTYTATYRRYKPGHAKGAQESVSDLLALEAGVVACAVAGLMDFVK